MQIIIILATLLVVSLAAPTDVETVNEKVIAPDSEKLVKIVESVSQSSESPVVEKTDKFEEEKVGDKEEEKSEVLIPGGKAQATVAANTEAEEKLGEEVISDEEKDKNYREYSAVCRASTGATEEQIKASVKDVDDVPKAVKCYVKCMAEEYGVEKDQVLQKDVAKLHKPASLSVEEFEEITETCGSLQTDDPCDSAYLRYSCYFRTSGEKIRLA